jgi:hypothetical protein
MIYPREPADAPISDAEQEELRLIIGSGLTRSERPEPESDDRDGEGETP